MRPYILVLTALLSAASLNSCTGSAAYNPSLNLPGKPMKKDGFELSVGGALLPHARPDQMNRLVDPGVQGIVRYAFHDRLALAVNWWGSIANDQFNGDNWGLTGSAIYQLKDPASSEPIAIIPMYELVYLGRTIEGAGAALWIATWPWSGEKLSTYAGFAPFFGWYASDMDKNGYGAIVNFGAVMHVNDFIDVGIEAAGVMQVNRLDKRTHFILAPSAMITWRVQ